VAIPAGLMALLQGGGANPAVGGGMGAGPEKGLEVLASMQQSPPPDGEQDALKEASRLIGMVAARWQLRSPKATKFLAEALTKIQSSRETMAEQGSQQMSPPPDLGLAGGAGSAGAPPAGFPGM
jgi:hypothetical protein